MNPPDDAKFLKKHIKTGNIDVHPYEKALIVNYEIEATILGQLGDPMAGERKQCQKIVRLKDMNDNTDIKALASEVVQRCNLICTSKQPQIEQLLYYLQKRKSTSSSPASNQSDQLSISSDMSLDGDNFGGNSGGGERASINRLDDYIEMFYEEIPEKVKGTQLVLQVARNPDCMEELLNNDVHGGYNPKIKIRAFNVSNICRKSASDWIEDIVYVNHTCQRDIARGLGTIIARGLEEEL